MLISLRGSISSKQFRELSALNWVIKHYDLKHTTIEYERNDESQQNPDFALTLRDEGKVIIECTTAPRFTRSQMLDKLLEDFRQHSPVTDEAIINQVINGLPLFWNTPTQVQGKRVDKLDYKIRKEYYLNIIFTKLHRLKTIERIDQVALDKEISKLNDFSGGIELSKVEMHDAHEVYDDEDEKKQIEQLLSIIDQKFEIYKVANNIKPEKGIKKLLVIDLSGFSFCFLRLENDKKLEHLSGIQTYLKESYDQYFDKILIIQSNADGYIEFTKNRNGFYLESFRSS